MYLYAVLQTILCRGMVENFMLGIIGQFTSFTFELLEKSIFLPFYCHVSTLPQLHSTEIIIYLLSIKIVFKGNCCTWNFCCTIFSPNTLLCTLSCVSLNEFENPAGQIHIVYSASGCRTTYLSFVELSLSTSVLYCSVEKRGTAQYISFPLFCFKEERENPAKRSRIERDIDNNLITSTPQTGEKPNKQISRVRRKGQVNGGL